MATEETARLFLELVANGVEQASRSLNALAGQADKAAQSWSKLATGWRSIRSGEYAARAQEMALLTREQQKLAEAQRKIDIIAREGKFLGNLTIMQERLQSVGKVGAYAFGILSVSLGAWVRSGMQGTAEAARLSLAFNQISRSIADIFAPWIQKTIDRLTTLAERFRSLSGEQQQSIRRWVALGAVLSGTMLVLPKLIGMLHATAAAFQAVGLAKLAALAGPVGIGVAVGAVAIGGLAAASPAGRDALGELWKAAQPLLAAFGQLAGTLTDALVPVINAYTSAMAVFAKILGPLLGALGRLVEAAGPLIQFMANLAGLIQRVVGPVLETLAGWLGDAVDALARFIEALGKAINWLADRLGLEREATLEELRAWVDHLEKARRENAAELERIARERTAGALGGEAYLEEQRRRLERMTAGPQKTTLSQAPAGFEGAEDLYTRIATTAAKTDQARAADAAEATQETLEVIARQLAALTGWSFEQAMERVRALPQAGAV